MNLVLDFLIEYIFILPWAFMLFAPVVVWVINILHKD